MFVCLFNRGKMKIFSSLVLTSLMIVAVSSNSAYAYGYKYSNNPYSGECRLQLNLPGYGENSPPRRYGTPYYSKHPTIGHPSPSPTYNGQPSALAPRRPSQLPRPVSRPSLPSTGRFPPPSAAANPNYAPEIRRPSSAAVNPNYAPEIRRPSSAAVNPNYAPEIRRPPSAAVNPNYAPEIRRPPAQPRPLPPPRRDYDRDVPQQPIYRRPSSPRRPPPAPPARRPSAPRAPAVTPRRPPPAPREPDYVPSSGTYAPTPDDYEQPQEPYAARPDLPVDNYGGGINDYDPPVGSREVDSGFEEPSQYVGDGEFEEPEEPYVGNEVEYEAAADGGTYGGGNSGGGAGGVGGRGAGADGNYGGRGSGRGGRGGGAGGRYGNEFKKKK